MQYLIDPTGHDCVYAGNNAANSTVVRGDCISDTDGGVFVNGRVDGLTDNADGKTVDAHWSDYAAANNQYLSMTAASVKWIR